MSLMSKIEAYLRTRKMKETRFGRLVANDPRLVRDMRNGREPGVRMCNRIENFMSDWKPR
ncbi:hypothetical protein H5J25_08075 [Sphingomonas aliaeris]|uniref:Uncharacterized protein n=1 Tax=Sphingomonas aliaeris TaxID=2759526 RepID=A0A974S5H1_9SPHN|nr:hypothetical protein [Sphingomonas aliaeris]QQV78564.1 hypothetical protein H5J25_08075 [Sphingomonas aliaeris]